MIHDMVNPWTFIHYAVVICFVGARTKRWSVDSIILNWVCRISQISTMFITNFVLKCYRRRAAGYGVINFLWWDLFLIIVMAEMIGVPDH
jgi:hypothetical protein